MDHKVKLKESEKKPKKSWNTKVAVIPIIIVVLGTVLKDLVRGREELEIGWLGETTQTTAFLESDRLLRSILESWEELMSLRL